MPYLSRVSPRIALALLLGACLAPAGPARADSGYHVARRVELPGKGRWDYLSLDPSGNRLYVAHAGTIQVVDTRTLRLLGSVEGSLRKPHGAVVLPGLGKGFATDGAGGVVVFDLKTLRRLAVIRSRPDSDGILYDPDTRRVIVWDGDSRDATAIDPEADRVVKVLPLGGAPEAGASDGHGRIFDNLVSRDQVVELDARRFTVLRRWSTLPGRRPTGMALDRIHHRLFVGCRNKLLIVMDSGSGRVLAHLPIGGHVDATAFDPATGDVLDTCGEGGGTLSVIHQDGPDRYRVVENAPTLAGARTMALDAARNRVYTDATLGPKASPTGFALLELSR